MRQSHSTSQLGFTLIEALVALVVLSIGLLGVAAMQLKALQGAHAAYQRSIASLAAQDAQERLWAKMAVDIGTICPAGSDVDDIQSDWQGEWGVFLPGFSTSSTLTGNLACEYEVGVVWGEERFGEVSENFLYAFRLPSETRP
jgi:type IV pilus assembly protein PilV